MEFGTLLVFQVIQVTIVTDMHAWWQPSRLFTWHPNFWVVSFLQHLHESFIQTQQAAALFFADNHRAWLLIYLLPDLIKAKVQKDIY